MNNYFDGKIIDEKSFSTRDLQGMDIWQTFTPIFGSLTVVGATNYIGRYRIVGRQFQGQVSFSAATSIASTAGTSYLTLPTTAKGLTGFGIMSNSTTHISVGNCHLDVTNSSLYLPTQIASGNVFNLYFEYEI